uniref:Peptidase M20 dimerisation domain-containing protein n=1 Tax=Plectus sambesii TaxID=2011161 RepID=A0A914XJ90_9BILA
MLRAALLCSLRHTPSFTSFAAQASIRHICAMAQHQQQHDKLCAWIDTHFDEEVAFLQSVIRIPTDTPPGDNAPHADAVAHMVEGFGWTAEKHVVPHKEVADYGMASLTNVIIRRKYGDGGPVVALNAHGDVVPPGEGWTTDPYGGEIRDGRIYGRAAATSKSDFATYIYAVRALESLGGALKGGVELHFTYDEEFGGLLGPGWLLEQKLTKPDFAIGAGFSYNVMTAHSGCLQFEVTVQGKATHGSIPESGHDALQATTTILNAIYAKVKELSNIRSKVE